MNLEKIYCFICKKPVDPADLHVHRLASGRWQLRGIGKHCKKRLRKFISAEQAHDLLSSGVPRR